MIRSCFSWFDFTHLNMISFNDTLMKIEISNLFPRCCSSYYYKFFSMFVYLLDCISTCLFEYWSILLAYTCLLAF